MHIANPIYDVVFKYLMEDAKVAKLLISSIIGEEIEELDFRPQEFTTDIDKSRIEGRIGTLTVYRLDFTARISTKEVSKNVIIEIQKAKFATDIMRFRSYLGNQYSDTSSTQIVTINNHTRNIGMPIIGIYFLGHKLDHNESAVIGVNRVYTDLITGEILTTKESFIESLTHDSYVIQIPNLRMKRRTELEALLSIFDQTLSVDAAHHMLNVQEGDFPEKYRPLIRRLQMAVSEPEMRKQMTLEDGLLQDFENMQREIEEYKQKTAEAEKIIEEAEKSIAEEKLKTAEAEKVIEVEKQKTAEAERSIAEEKQKTAEAEKAIEVEKQKTAEAERSIAEEKQNTAEAKKAIGVEKQKAAEAILEIEE